MNFCQSVLHKCNGKCFKGKKNEQKDSSKNSEYQEEVGVKPVVPVS